MSLIKRPYKDFTKTKESTYLGVRIPNEVGSFLTLYCIAKGETKSNIINAFLLKWVNDRREEIPHEELVKEIVKRSIVAYDTRPVRSVPFLSFCSMLRNEFKLKGLPEELIDKILKKVVHEKKQRDKT